MKDLLDFIGSFADVSKTNWEALRFIVTEIELKKGERLVEFEKPCKSLFFISKGYCRSFYIKDGEEINTNFYFEKEMVTSIHAYVKNEVSSYAIEACEAVIAYRLDKHKILGLSKRFPEIGMMGKENLQLIAARQEKQLDMYRLLTAEQRYHYLEENQPELLQRVSLTQLASYLGVARETLSRIRRKRLSP